MAVKSAVYDYSLYTPDYYLKGFLAGGVCCSVTRCVEIKSHCAAQASMPAINQLPLKLFLHRSFAGRGAFDVD